MKFFFFLPLSFLLLLTSCTTSRMYDGATRSKNETSRLRAYGVTLRSIDNRTVGSSVSSVEILPGKHLVEVTPNASNYGMLNSKDKLLRVVFTAEAGKDYALTSKRGQRTLCAYECLQGTSKPDFSKSAGCVVHPSLVDQKMMEENPPSL